MPELPKVTILTVQWLGIWGMSSKNVLRVNRLLYPVRRLGGMAIASAVRVEAIRRYALTRTVPLRIQQENYPSLEAKYLDNARLYATREDLLSSMRYLEGGIVAEVGVAHGDFSEELLNILKPEKFVAIDIFTMHEQSRYDWKNRYTLRGTTHLDYYKRKFADRGTQIVIEPGMSHICLAKYPDRTFDFIYLDADHSYEAVKQDLNVAKVKLADNGVIMLNDYIMFDHWGAESYGVVQAVNEFIVREDWRIFGFSLERNMFCDIAIRRRS